jgi:MFS transporter, NNP family, nitrate/nitrite transporter
MTFQEAPSPGPRAAVTLVVTMIGLGLNLRAAMLLGPHLHERFGVTPAAYVVLIGLPVLVAALVRVPVGVLTDRFGARIMFPAVSLAAALPVVVLGLTDSLPVAVVAGTTAGVSGSAFVVGAALVARTFPYGRRGRALGVFGLGAALAIVFSATSRGLDPAGQAAALVLGGLLVGFAGLAALLLRDPVPAERSSTTLRMCLDMVRLATGTSVSLLYVLALGGIVSIAIFLPIYLSTTFGFEWFHATAVTGVMVVLSAVARLGGGWWTDRRPTAGMLTICYGVAAALCLVAASAPRSWWLVAPTITGIAVCDGIASGALLALIGKATRADNAGAVMGVTGAAGSFGALLPPLLLAGLYNVTGSSFAAWALLATMLLAGAWYVRTRGLYVGLGLAVRFEPEPGPATMTVAFVGEAETRLGAAAVVARLAELATSDELIVVYGAEERQRAGLSTQDLADGLRDRLPRHSVVAIRVTPQAEELGRDALLLGEYLEAGTLAIAATPAVGLRSVAADLSLYLQADRMVRVSYTPAEGAGLQKV